MNIMVFLSIEREKRKIYNEISKQVKICERFEMKVRLSRIFLTRRDLLIISKESQINPNASGNICQSNFVHKRYKNL